MRYSHQSIVAGLGLLFSSWVHALDFYADALYWQPSETVDWALTNSNIGSSIPTQQIISYNTILFNYAPGFRVGVGLKKEDWVARALYTRYNAQTQASASGNVISTFMPSKFNSKFYQSGHVDFSMDFNLFDADLSKRIQVDDDLAFNPVIGLRGGWINQQINTRYQNPIAVPAAPPALPLPFNPNDVLECVSNNFSGLGPKVGGSGQWYFYKKNTIQYSLVGDFSTSYLWGRWFINDTLYQHNSEILGAVDVGKRDFGAFAIQGFIGINLDYKQYSVKVGYEASDWFNQYQVFDNGSGTHTNDLVLQGLTLAISYRS